MPNFLALDKNDLIVKPFAESLDAKFIESYKLLKTYPADCPVIFRGMAGKKIVTTCENQRRSYYYIDTGYIGNMQKRKDWHRIVLSGMQHSKINYALPNNRFENIAASKPYLRFPGWKKDGKAILVVTPSEKPCKFYGIDRNEFVSNTLETLAKHTDRPIIVRDKVNRRDRVGDGSIYNQLDEDNIFAVVTYNSIAATEAIGYGIPCFTLAPNAADEFCEKDLSLIESPKYEETEKVQRWQHWLAYCQYVPREMQDGTAFKLIEEHNLK
tara:strand:- start:1421 stop:2227 length:807 start_codon:yes stop_codon:yes gene_type:complete